MKPISPQLLSAVRYAALAPLAQHNDKSTATELNGRTACLRLTPGLTLQWLGTSGFRIAYQGVTILIDPYVSRIPLRDLLRRRVAISSPERVATHLPDRVDAIFIGHTHFDHAIDAPAIAQRDGCKVYGSKSMQHLMGLFGVAENSVVVDPYQTYTVGPFEIEFVPSLHSRLMLGLAVPFAGDICCEHLDELVPQAYCCGQVYGIAVRVAGLTFYHQGSADLIDSAMVHTDVDVFLAGIAGRGFTRDFVGRICRQLRPRVVVPHHYDDFFRPLEKEMRLSFNVNLGGFVEEVGHLSRDIEMCALLPMQATRCV